MSTELRRGTVDVWCLRQSSDINHASRARRRSAPTPLMRIFTFLPQTTQKNTSHTSRSFCVDLLWVSSPCKAIFFLLWSCERHSAVLRVHPTCHISGPSFFLARKLKLSSSMSHTVRYFLWTASCACPPVGYSEEDITQRSTNRTGPSASSLSGCSGER